MKKVYLLSFLFISIISFGQNFDSFASGVKINNTIYNTTASAPIHQINPNASAQNFDGLNLGNYGQNSSCARITGAEIKTWKNPSGNVCSANLYWRVYPSSSTPTGSFNPVLLTSVSNCDSGTNIFTDGFGPCGNNDQKWKNYSVNSDFVSGLLPGNYTLEIYYDFTGSDVNSNTCETTKYISNSGSNFKAIFTISNPTCNPTVSATTLCEGDLLTLTSNPANGSAPYTYNWTGPNGYTSAAANPTITTTLASAGTYSLIVTDSCGAVSTTQTTQAVVINSKITPEFEGLNPGLCKNGTPPLLPTQSTNGINGTWSPAVVDNTTAGTFFYTFTPDAGQCANTFTQIIFVVNNVNPTFSFATTICQNATAPSLPATSVNGIVGTWSPSTVSNTATGTYTFTPNAGQCAIPKTVIVTVVPNVAPTFTLPSSICEGATPPVLPTTSNNGVTGTWNPSIVSNTTTGTYIFTHTAGQCATNTTVTITVNPNILPTFDAIAPICENAAAPILPTTSTNGITGTWSPATVSNTTSGTYTFTPTAGLCALTTTMEVTVNPNILPIFDPIPNVCYQTTAPSLPTTSNNGITGTWNPATISNTASGTYTFTPTPGLCALSTTLNVIVDIITPTFDTIAPICSGTTAPLLSTTSNNGITGTWNPATVDNTTTATYTFTPDANQCATTATLSVTITPNVTPTFNTIAPICENAVAPILPTSSINGITGTWNPATVDNTVSGTYTFTPDAGICATTTNLDVTVIPNITPTFNLIPPICSGSPAPVLPTTSTNGITGTWSPATVSNTVSGNYVFTPNAGIGQCVLTKTLHVTVKSILTPTFDSVPNVCFNGTIPTLPTTSNNGIDGTWSPAVVSNTASATYTFTPNAGECAIPTTLAVTVDSITPTFDPIAPICFGTTTPSLPTTSTNGITGTWNPATVDNTSTTTYTFTPDANQCATATLLTVTITPNITPVFDAITPICYGATAPTLLLTSNNGITGTWNPATVDNTTSGTYTFTPDTGQCATTATIDVIVNPIITPTFTTIDPICEGATAPSLPTTSNNGIAGTWNPATISNTTSGTYIFTPNAGLCASSTSIDVVVNPNVTPTFDAIDPICSGTTAPTLPTTSNNGITGTWNPAIINNTTSGTYTFTPDAGQCAIAATLNVTITPYIVPTFDPIPNVCYQTTAPTLPLTSTNGITGTWNPATVSNTQSGTYTFTPDTGQCATTKTLNVTITTITPTFDPITPICYGTTAPILASTSNNGITGAWNPATISNTDSATYTFTPDAGQCATTATLNVTINSVTPTFDAIADVCYGSTAPVLATTSNNGIIGTWNPTTVSNTTAGTYTFTPNAGQCAIEVTITVNVTTINPTFDPTAPICENATAPTLPTSSTNGITGTWSPAVSNTATGTYTFTPDANQCATTAILTITVTPNVTPTFDPIADICFGNAAPALPLTSTNGITGTWNPAVISNAVSGTYTFTPTAGQCATTATLNINVTTINPTFDPIVDVCYGSTSPTLPLTSTNGITGTWNPATVNNTAAGTYTFTPDAGQCATTTSLNIGITVITPTFNPIASICENATVPTLPLTSTNGITGTWNPTLVSNTTSGTYTFTPNAGQCAVNTTLDVVVNPIITPVFDPIADVCYGSTAPALPLTSTNGITGTWNPAVVSNTDSGTYTFTPDAGQCATTAPLTINVTTIIPVFAGIAPICENATAPTLPLTSTNGITGTWNPATMGNTATATYTFTPDANQCATTATLEVIVNPNVTPTFDPIADVCYGSTAPTLPLTSTNGITGTWNPATVGNTTAGTYTFTPDANQCAVSTTISINVTTINPTFDPIADVCYGSTAPILPLTSTNGITGTWNPTTVSNTTAGTYTFTPDAGQCATTATLSVNINAINPTFAPIADVCYGSTAPTLTLTSTNGITGTWNPATVSNTAGATYTFTPDAGQCATTATLSINVTTITPDFTAIAPICENATAPVLPTTSNNGIIGTWNSVVSNTATGTYTFTPNAGQCATTATLTIVVTPNVTPAFTAIAPICENATAPTLPTSSTNGITGTWNSTVSNTATGTYTFTPDAGQCAVSTTLTVTVIPNVTPTFTAYAPICSGSAAPILPSTSNNGYTGTWNPAAVSNSASGTYTFTPDAGQCATTTTLSIVVNNSPTDLDITTANVYNQTSHGAIIINGVTSGVGPFSYSINNGSFTTNSEYGDLAPGEYIVTVRDSNGCEYEEAVTIESSCMFPNGISPNGDYKNDTFNLNGCNVKKLELFNRYGVKINSYSNYVSEWDGTTSDGKELPDGTYFYVAKLADGTSKTGWVYIAR